nr:SusC/RagA family TonB-linked outer membrane protein [uncultured Flavobacterium sp.]
MRLKLKWFFTLMMAFLVQLSFAQEKTVTGTVVEGGFPLPGVSVVVKGTTNGTQTDFDGKYSIKVNKGETLVYSFIGMKTVSQTVGESSTMNLTMVAEDSQLEEVIVMAYGQAKKKNEVTGSAVKIDGETISKVPLVSADQALQGRVAGLQMATTSGTPGSTQQIRIRGIAGIGGDLEPLIVIDGVPVINSDFGSEGGSSLSALSSINANDIASMTVLKDATATAPYGARGAAGVIVITTKKGKSGATKYSLTTTAGIQNKAVKGLEMASGAQKEELFLESLYNTYGGVYGFSKDQTYDYFTANQGNIPANASSAFDNLVKWKNAGSQEYRWNDLLENKDALYYNLDFSAQGGDEKSTFYASLGYNKTESIAFGGDFRRVTGNIAYDRQLSDKVKFSSNVRVANTKQNAIMEGGAYFSNPLLTKYFMSPWYSPYNADGSYNTNVGSLHNSLYTISNNKDINDLTRLLGSFAINYDITKGLKWTSNVNLDYNFSDYSGYKNPNHGDGVVYNGYAENSWGKNFNYVVQNSLDYAFGIEKHKFNAKALMEYQKNKYSSLYGFGESVPPGFDMLGNAAANWSASSAYNDWAQLSYTAMVNYNYDGKYLVDGSFRREGSSKFNEDKRWGNFWSVGAAWNIMNEDFMDAIPEINVLRARASYGTTGNNGIGLNMYQSLLATGSYDGQGSFALSQLASNLSWETQAKTDVGVDFGLFNNKISGSVAYYNSKSEDLLFSTNPISGTTGFSTKATNAGAMRNRGMEYELNIDVVRSENFNFNVSANFATVKNKVLEMPVDASGNPISITSGTRVITEGQPLYAWNMRKYAGVNPDNGNALYYINGQDGATTENYNQAAVALQGDSALPKYTGGLTLHFDFHNFFLDGTFYYSGGNKVYEDWASYTQNTGRQAYTYNYSSTTYENRWKQPGDVTSVPKVTGTTSTSEQISTRFLADGDFVRLRDVAFGYSFKPEMIKGTGLDGITLSLRGTNLWTWVKDDNLNYDPEVRADGFTNIANPPIKQVSFSANIKF